MDNYAVNQRNVAGDISPYTVSGLYFLASKYSHASRWASLRAAEGWAALQHHSVLRTSLTVYPPSFQQGHEADPPHLLLNVQQGTFFALRPVETSPYLNEGFVPKWHAGNVYAMDAAPPHAVPLPFPPSLTGPTTYDLIISGDYEVRQDRLLLLLYSVHLSSCRSGSSGIPPSEAQMCLHLKLA